MDQLASDLTRAFALISKPETWGRRQYRRWDRDRRVHCYCAVGALLHVIAREDPHAGKVTEILGGSRMVQAERSRFDDACEIIGRIACVDDGMRPLHARISQWNDDPLTYHEDIVYVFTEAINEATASGID